MTRLGARLSLCEGGQAIGCREHLEARAAQIERQGLPQHRIVIDQ
jgi:hypothetical protein